jgi:hypothetical protein
MFRRYDYGIITNVELGWDCPGDVHWNSPTCQNNKDKEDRRPISHYVHPYIDDLRLPVGTGNRHQRSSFYLVLHVSHSHQLAPTLPDLEVQGSQYHCLTGAGGSILRNG